VSRRIRERIGTACLVAAAAFSLVLLAAPGASAQETVRITLPATVTFSVANVRAGTQGTPAPTSITANQLALVSGHGLRISVKADGDLIGTAGSIPASRVSWTTSSVSKGVGSNGTLSTAAYTQLFIGQANSSTGRVDVTWTLSAPGTALRASTYQATLRWKLESVVP